MDIAWWRRFSAPTRDQCARRAEATKVDIQLPVVEAFGYLMCQWSASAICRPRPSRRWH